MSKWYNHSKSLGKQWIMLERSVHKQGIILTSEIESLLRIILPCCFQICLYKVNFSVQYNERIERFKHTLTVNYNFLKE